MSLPKNAPPQRPGLIPLCLRHTFLADSCGAWIRNSLSPSVHLMRTVSVVGVHLVQQVCHCYVGCPQTAAIRPSYGGWKRGSRKASDQTGWMPVGYSSFHDPDLFYTPLYFSTLVAQNFLLLPRGGLSDTFGLFLFLYCSWKGFDSERKTLLLREEVCKFL